MSGMPPIPICRVAPSSINSSTFSPIAFSTAVAALGSRMGSSSSCSTMWFTWSTCTKQSPSTRGMRSFTCTMTVFASSTAALEARVSTPRLMNPCWSGGETWTMATSRGSTRSLKSRGMWKRKTGV